MTHDYLRNGTTTLFAAFDLASGSVIAQPYRRRYQEFLRFLKLIDSAVPDDLDLHLVLDDYATQVTADATAGGEPGRDNRARPAACRYRRHPSDMAPAAPARAPAR